MSAVSFTVAAASIPPKKGWSVVRLTRETPDYIPLVNGDAKRARELLASCRFHMTTYGGRGWAMTNDPSVRDELCDGWTVVAPDGETFTVACGKGGVFKYEPAGENFYELQLPVALVALSRELHDNDLVSEASRAA